MNFDLELKQIAIHYVDKTANILEYSSGVQEIETLDPTIVTFLLSLAHNLKQVHSWVIQSC